MNEPKGPVQDAIENGYIRDNFLSEKEVKIVPYIFFGIILVIIAVLLLK